jgi:hypothetical protein
VPLGQSPRLDLPRRSPGSRCGCRLARKLRFPQVREQRRSSAERPDDDWLHLGRDRGRRMARTSEMLSALGRRIPPGGRGALEPPSSPFARRSGRRDGPHRQRDRGRPIAHFLVDVREPNAPRRRRGRGVRWSASPVSHPSADMGGGEGARTFALRGGWARQPIRGLRENILKVALTLRASESARGSSSLPSRGTRRQPPALPH